MISKFTGEQFDKKLIPEHYLVELSNYIYDNFFFMDYSKLFSPEEIVLTAEKMVISRQVDILVIDSYNKIDHDLSATGNETAYISKLLDLLERLAKKHKLIVILVAHPRKMEKEKDSDNYKMPKAYDINGSAHFYNKSDYVITVHRNFTPSFTSINVDKVKFKNYGTTGTASLGYDLRSGNYYDFDESTLDLFGSMTIPEPPTFEKFVVPDNYKVRTTEELLSTTVSYFKERTSILPQDVRLYDFLTSNKYVDKVKYVRAGSDTKERKQRKNESQLPLVSVSVRLEGGKSSQHIVEKTNLICIDIDYAENEEIFKQIPMILQSLDYVAFYQLSVSGLGYYGIIPIADYSFHSRN